MPLLSIAIPTFNQPEKFNKTIQSIIGQSALYAGDIEIVVRDDSTNNDTEKIIKSFSNSNINIKYFRGEKIGIDRADFFITEKSSGQYVWWFGDDEMAPGALKNVLYLLRQYPEIDFMWINSKSRQTGALGINLGESRFFKNGDEVIAELSDLIAYISALLFKRERYLPHIAEAQKYIGSAVAAIYPLLCILSEGGKFYFLSEPCVIGDDKKPSEQLPFFNVLQVWGINMYKIFSEFEGKFSDKAIKTALSKNFKGVWKGIIVARAKNYTVNLGAFSYKHLLLFFKLYWRFFDFWLALPFFIMPRFLVGFFYKIYKFFIPQTHTRLGK